MTLAADVNLVLSLGLSTHITVGGQLRVAIGARVDVQGEFYAQGSLETSVVIGLEEGLTGFWHGLHSHASSILVVDYTRITQAEIAIYVVTASQVTVTHSWLIDNKVAIELLDDSESCDPQLLVNYTVFESNLEYNINASQFFFLVFQQ